MKQEKDILKATAVLAIIYPVYLTQAETRCFSVNHADKDFPALRVKEGQFGMDGTNVRRMDSLLQQK